MMMMMIDDDDDDDDDDDVRDPSDRMVNCSMGPGDFDIFLKRYNLLYKKPCKKPSCSGYLICISNTG